MYAIIKTGGKQHRVSPGDVLSIEKVEGDVGGTIELGSVLFISDDGNVSIGNPTVAGAAVTAEVLKQDRLKKILVFKKKRRKTYERTKGHRQAVTQIKITAISAG